MAKPDEPLNEPEESVEREQYERYELLATAHWLWDNGRLTKAEKHAVAVVIMAFQQIAQASSDAPF